MQDAATPSPWTVAQDRRRAPDVAYRGRLGEVWRIAIVTTALTIVTLGVYRFWATTRLRRYFWSHVALDDEPLEYAGTGLELFLGFLIVIAIVAPLYALMNLAGYIFPYSPEALAAIQTLPLLLFLALIPVAVFRARRYRLSRTLWRGVRAGQTGTVRGYWIRAVGYGLAGWLTLGLLRPLAHARLTGYLMNHTWFGTGRFRFTARARDLMWRWLLVWALLPAMAGLYFLLVMTLIDRVQRTAADPEAPPEMPLEAPRLILRAVLDEPILIGGAFAAVLLGVLGWALAYVWYRVHMTRLFTRGTTFEAPEGGVLRLTSRLRYWRVVGVYLLLAAVYLAILAAAGLIAGFSGEGAVVALVLAALLGGTLFAPFVTHPLLAHYVATLEVAGAVDFDAVAQNPETQPRTGEGLASVFDVDVG